MLCAAVETFHPRQAGKGFDQVSRPAAVVPVGVGCHRRAAALVYPLHQVLRPETPWLVVKGLHTEDDEVSLRRQYLDAHKERKVTFPTQGLSLRQYPPGVVIRDAQAAEPQGLCPGNGVPQGQKTVWGMFFCMQMRI